MLTFSTPAPYTRIYSIRLPYTCTPQLCFVFINQWCEFVILHHKTQPYHWHWPVVESLAERSSRPEPNTLVHFSLGNHVHLVVTKHPQPVWRFSEVNVCPILGMPLEPHLLLSGIILVDLLLHCSFSVSQCLGPPFANHTPPLEPKAEAKSVHSTVTHQALHCV